MKFESTQLLGNLQRRTQEVIDDLNSITSHTDETLRWRPAEISWTVMECVEHLLMYGDFYEKEFERRLAHNNSNSRPNHKTTCLGGKFAKSMSLSTRQKSKVSTLKSTNPLGQPIDRSAIDRLLAQQKQLLGIIDKSRTIDMQKTKVSTSLSRWLRLQYGDMLIVHVYHNQRHIAQMQEVIDAYHAADTV